MTSRGEHTGIWIALGAAAVVCIATLVLIHFAPTTPLPAARGPMMPRMRVPARSMPLGDTLRVIGVGTLTWYASVLSVPLFLWMSRRLPIDTAHWQRSVPIYAAVLVALVVVAALLQYRTLYAGFPGPSVSLYLRNTLFTGWLPFFTVAAATQAFEARARAHERDLDAARVRGQLAEARLDVLSAQLQPHFLFNTLQGISTLITRDPVAADKMLTSLSDLLREVLRRGERREVDLDEELRVLEPYLDISRWRFGDRLTVETSANDAARRALVPFFILQPLVENAVHHGVSSRAGPAAIHIEATVDRDRLWLSVTDDGPGVDAPDPRRGIGLTNTKARLEELYGDRHTLELDRPPTGGFRVRVGIPYRTNGAPRA
ncbi:MAG: sensor histidine kinase [Gemmatimonadaceae bacterium]